MPNFDLYRPIAEHDMLRDVVRSLAEAKIAPYAAAADEEARRSWRTKPPSAAAMKSASPMRLKTRGV